MLITMRNQTVYKVLYERADMQMKTGISNIEAELNYDQLVHQITYNDSKLVGLVTFESGEVCRDMVLQLRRVYTVGRYLALGSGVVWIICMFLLRKIRKQRCFLIGSVGALSISMCVVIVFVLLKTELRNAIVYDEYTFLVASEPNLVKILPNHWALGMILCMISIEILFVILCLLAQRLIQKRKQPHRFD